MPRYNAKFFDAAYYINANKDVAANWSGDVQEHFALYGAKEGRLPSSWFDFQYIRSTYSDLAGMTNEQLFTHYNNYGFNEGRVTAATYANFDAAKYLATYADLGSAGITAASALSHYLAFGAAESRTALNKDGSAISGNGTAVNVGSTFTLTTGVDNIAGTNGNDTVLGAITFTDSLTPTTSGTYSAADAIAGGLGTDTLSLTVDGGGATYTTGALPLANISGIETVNIRAVQTAAADIVSLDASGIAGLTTLNVNNSLSSVTVTNLAKGAAFGVNGDGAAQQTGAYLLGYAAAADVATLNIAGGVKGATPTTGPTITLSGTGLSSTVINTTGTAANVVGAITALGTSVTVNAASNLTGTLTAAAATKLTATGTAVVDFSGAALANNIVTVDASAMTAGGLKVAAGTSAAFKFTGGAGNDQVSTGNTLTTGLVDAGAGTGDRLVVATSAHIDATAGKLYKNFEQLQVNSAAGVATAVDIDHLATTNTIDTVRISQTGASATVSNLSATAAGNVAIVKAAPTTVGTDIINIGVKGATTAGQIDTVKAALTTTDATGAAQTIDLTGLTLSGVEKLELTGNGTAAATTGIVTFTTASATSLDSIKLANAANGNVITVAAGHTATNLVIDTSASTGGTTIDATANATTTGVNAKGGSSFDVIKGAVGLSDIITGGAGNDVLATGASSVTAGTASAIGSATAATAATAGDTMTGGDGRDMFVLGTNSALTTMSSITDLNLGGATAALGVDGITLDLATPGTTTAPTIVVLTDTQKANIAAAVDLATAFNVAAAVDTTVNAVVQFTYGTDTYLFVNGVAAGATYSATNDVAIKITGVSGTLDASDITIV